MRVKICTSWFSYFRGYMFSSKYYDALLFCFTKPRVVDLHMWFVFFPLDIYYLDAKGKVLATHYRVRPFRFHIAGVAASYILETARVTHYRVGQKVNIKHIKQQSKK